MTGCSVHPLGGPGLRRPFVAHDLAVLRAASGDAPARLFVVDTVGDQAYRFDLTADGPRRVRREFMPMRLFGGRALVGTGLGVWYDLGERWVPLVPQARPRYVDRAVVVTPIFDSREPGCVWHRLLLDGCIGPDTDVAIRSAASDDRAALDPPSRWHQEPAPYRRGDGPERPFVDRDTDPRYGTWELLLQEARGRYLRLELELKGNRETTPRLRALRAYYPRFSYLEEYLPAVYREEPTSARFLDGFLANLEGFYTAIEDRVASAEVLFDPRTAPREALDWLASWFEVVLDPAWDEARRRLFLRYAVELFRWRGTERGMRLALGVALLRCPDPSLFSGAAEPGGIRIVERFQTKRGPSALFGDPTEQALPREVRAGPRWAPGDGGAELHERYRTYLRQLADGGLIGGPVGNVRFPLDAPGGDRARAWRTFSAAVLGFVPSSLAASPEMRTRWSAFLARRYVQLDALNRAYQRIGGSALASFEAAVPPRSLPADGAPLADWYAFESVVVRSVRAAHRFSVMLPVPVGRATRGGVVRPSDVRDRIAEQERVKRLVDLEKPAHTVFDVKSFWLGFRVGEARLGKDTLLDFGSRSPDLRPPAVLGSLHVGESVLTSRMADLPERPAVFSGSVDAATRRVVRRTDG
jgi:phage tail-like protein